MLQNSPKLIKAIKAEKKAVEYIVKSNNIDGIISDNRFRVYSKNVPSVYITHQLNVLSGNTTWLSSKIHQRIIKKFDECWVPDVESSLNLSGRLGHVERPIIATKYLGILSRFNSLETEKTYELIVLLSGPEPQRGILELQLLKQIYDYKGKVLFVKGKIEANQAKEVKHNVTFLNYLTSHELNLAINKSNIVLSRSGYTTILDLAKLGKKVFFIPTPGQFEQEYLAKQLSKKGIAPFCIQNEFTIDKLDVLKDYSGFKKLDSPKITKELFSLF
jgi:uncharacterized protein (TIGR00661 family)